MNLDSLAILLGSIPMDNGGGGGGGSGVGVGEMAEEAEAVAAARVGWPTSMAMDEDEV